MHKRRFWYTIWIICHVSIPEAGQRIKRMLRENKNMERKKRTMRKKLITLALVLLLVIGCAIPAGATGPAVTCRGAATADGSKVTVSLTVDGDAGSGSFALRYDPSLTLTAAETELTLADIAQAPGSVTFAWTAAVEAETTLLVLTFDGARCGTCEFPVEDCVVYDSAYQAVPVEDFTVSVYIPCGGTDCPSAAFQDVDVKQWYHDAVDYVLVNGLMEGLGDGVFAPDAVLTRGMLVKILGTMENIDPDDYLTRSFRDVSGNAWYAPYVEWAHKNGMAKGYGDGIFAPNKPVTREEMATFFYRYWKWKGGSHTADDAALQSFTDASQVSSWALEAMQWAVQTGLINGVGDSTLAPRGTATRAQVAKIIMVYMTEL